MGSHTGQIEHHMAQQLDERTNGSGPAHDWQVSIEDVHKRFGEQTAVDGVSLKLAAGEIFGLLGPNGAGKTTTIRMMLDIIRPDSGHISVFGGPMTQAKKSRIGYLPEERGLYADQKLMGVIRYLASLKGMSRAETDERAEVYLKRLDLWSHRDKKLSEMSRGMHQKAQFIVTILHDPDLIIVDEPFSGLDPINTELIRQILLDLRDAHKTIVMSTHQMHQVEEICDRMALLHDGRVVLDGEVEAVRQRFAGNTVEVRGSGPIDTLPMVKHARRERNAWRLTLADEESPQALLKMMVERPDITVEHFSVALPSLHEIFIQTVGHSVEEVEASTKGLVAG